MPRKDKPQNGQKTLHPKAFEFAGFISCSLSDEEKAAFGVWHGEHNFEWQMEKVLEMVDRSYKFTTSLNNNNNAVICTYTCNNPAVSDYGWALSGFGPDMPTALAVLNFKHTVILNETWSKNQKEVKQFTGIG